MAMGIASLHPSYGIGASGSATALAARTATAYNRERLYALRVGLA